MVDLVRRFGLCCCVLLAAGGCTRTHYRQKADAETYCILTEKTAAMPWQPPPGFSVQPDPRSRFFDPTPTDDPCLPIPAPELYGYRLPELPARDPARFRGPNPPQRLSSIGYAVPPLVPPPVPAPLGGRPAMAPPGPIPSGPIPAAPVLAMAGIRRLPPVDAGVHVDPFVQQVAFQQADAEGAPSGAELRMFATQDSQASGPDGSLALAVDEPEPELRIVPIPRDVWQSLPSTCLMRMFEFGSVRQEYQRSYGREPGAAQRDPSQRLALEDIVELALINSREYQTQKENLYRDALSLTLERFDYELKFATGGNGTAVDYTHNRNGGRSVNSLAVPTTITGNKLLYTGGDLLARFANDVVLTFNGTDGFAADVGSELLLDISQSIFQRDLVFENLTQAERDVVYAARDFARFRKELFADPGSGLAAEYYGLLLAYRGIEIETQNYFSNLRQYLQGEAEYRAGRLPRLEVDQLEQTALSSRSSLIGRCNSLEGSLDGLKLSIGLPPELPINLDLMELEELTLRDEATVLGQRVWRARRELLSQRSEPAPDRGVLLNAAIDLTQKMLQLMELRRRLQQDRFDVESLDLLLARLSVDEARMLSRSNREFLQQELQAVPLPPPVRIFRRTTDAADSLLELTKLHLELAAKMPVDLAIVENIRRRRGELATRFTQIGNDVAAAIANQQLDRMGQLNLTAKTLLKDAEALAREGDGLTQAVLRPPEEELQETLDTVQRLLAESQQLLEAGAGGLTPIELEMDDAMLTALVSRFDLMNRRGELADTWRQIKLAGDDLKSVLNLSAQQSIRTRSNRPFGFTFDESQTRVALTLDTPLNRKAQRNAFRRSLIDYQAGLRNLMQLEDSIKLSVRNDLRDLQLRQEQYQIAVASAALASERVVSTRLLMDLGMDEVRARDFLEAQQAYTQSLNDVASEHIGYILDRVQLFLDLELLEVDDGGFWPELYNERYQPDPHYQLPPYARPAYGRLPCGVCYSGKVKRMLKVPTGSTGIYKEPPQPLQDPAPMPEEVPAPLPQKR